MAALAAYQATLAFFDEYARSEATGFNADGEGGRAKTLLSILQKKNSEYLRETEAAGSHGDVPPAGEGGRVDAQLRATRRRAKTGPIQHPIRSTGGVGDLGTGSGAALRSMRLRVRTSAGLALLKLEAVANAINPQPRLLDVERDGLTAASDLLRWISSEDHSLFKAVWREQLDAADRSIIDKRVADLRDSIDRLREDLRRRIGATRSRLALVRRSRCDANGTIVNACSLSRTTADFRAGRTTD